MGGRGLRGGGQVGKMLLGLDLKIPSALAELHWQSFELNLT